MAGSKIEICSAALVLLGQSRINSFAEDSTGLCDAWWDTVRKSTLRLGTWQCARKRVLLAPLATTPGFEWAYQFQIPTECLRIVSVGESGDFDNYEIENNLILSAQKSIKLRFVYDNEVTSTWDSILTEAVALHMAWVKIESHVEVTSLS